MRHVMIRAGTAAALLAGGLAACATSPATIVSAPVAMPSVAVRPAVPRTPRPVWTTARARAWADSTGWLVGSNFAPSTAINQLEMWQPATFDPATIDRELGYAQTLGFNTMRVFLHDLLWQQDSSGFLGRMDQFLAIADRHRIRPMFVLFDAVWDPFPHLGPQRAPIPHVHNSGWVQSPGVVVLTDTVRQERLRGYVQGVVCRFGQDHRVLAWDVFNEADNVNRPTYLA